MTNKEAKIGHWIFDDECKEHGHCSHCGYGSVDLVDGEPHNFCRNCGAMMVKLQKSEDKVKLIKELNDIRQELLNRSDQYITFRDLVERFDYADAEFNHTPWNLLQIYTNFNVLIGEESESE